MSLFKKKIINQNNKQETADDIPYFSSVILNSVNILKTSFTYLGENYSTGLYIPPEKNLPNDNIVANFRNPTNKLINDTNFQNLEIYNLGIINNETQYITGITSPTSNINSPIAFNIFCNKICNISIIAGSLPQGLELTSYNGSIATITGSVTNIDTSKLYYDFVVRVENIDGVYVDRYFRFINDPSLIGISWNQSWLNSLTSITNTYEYNNEKVYPLVYSSNTIDNIYSMLLLDNPYGLDVSYEIMTNTLTTNNNIIPNGIFLENDNGLFNGIPSKNNNLNTYYFFSIKASINFDGKIITGNSENDTSDTIFYFYIDSLSQNNTTNHGGNGAITWITETNLGSVYEQEPMFFNVQAISTNSENVTYTLINSTMSASMTLTEDGFITGYATFTYGKNQNVSFTVRANDGYITSDKTFAFVIIGQHQTDNLLSVSFPIFYNEEKILKQIIYDPNIVPDEYVFRLNVDENFGRIKQYQLLLVNSIKNTNVTLLEKNLYQYYRPLNLRFGSFGYVKVYDPNNNYVYDVVFINIIDSNDNGNAFVNNTEEIFYSQTNSLKNGLPQWNIPTGNYQKTRIFPTNLYNMRENILLTTNREGYQENLATDEYQFPEGYQRGVGVDQTETLPLWMVSEFNGWGSAIPLVYLNKGYGEIVLNNIQNNKIINEIMGKQITINEFCLTDKEFSFTIFDEKSSDFTELGVITSFDSCASTDSNENCIELQPSMSSWTEFDYSVIQTSYYIKFPPGDTY